MELNDIPGNKTRNGYVFEAPTELLQGMHACSPCFWEITVSSNSNFTKGTAARFSCRWKYLINPKALTLCVIAAIKKILRWKGHIDFAPRGDVQACLVHGRGGKGIATSAMTCRVYEITSFCNNSCKSIANEWCAGMSFVTGLFEESQISRSVDMLL